jgi:hypothetical protein
MCYHIPDALVSSNRPQTAFSTLTSCRAFVTAVSLHCSRIVVIVVAGATTAQLLMFSLSRGRCTTVAHFTAPLLLSR